MDESTLPIDIHTNKLLDWLISRRHCSKDWQHSLTVIREKIKAAIQDMPPNETISKLLSGSYIDYFTSKKIVDILKETEANSKNIFGFYSSQRMKDWNEIIKMYEKDNVYLAEGAQILIRNVNYEVPSLKKQISKYQQLAEECEKSCNEQAKHATIYRNDYFNAALKLGVEGKDLRKELLVQLEELPQLLNEIAKNIHKLEPVKNYYQQFLEFTVNKKESDLTVLNHILSNGNTTYYEFRTGETPELIEESKSIVTLTTENGNSVNNDQIDFGDGIDFGDDTASTESPSTGNGDFVHIEREDLTQEQSAGEINWDINISGALECSETTIINDNDGRVARGVDAQTIMEVAVTRNTLINELRELEGFLEQRLFEMKLEDDIISSNQFQSAPTELQLTTADGIELMLKNVQDILNQLVNSKMKTLYYMKESPKYIENIIDKLNHFLMLSEKAQSKSEQMIEKRLNFLEEMTKLEPQIPLIIEKTKDLQKKLENDISKRYKNRPVNIMGGIQILY